jgi:hypothetical protein
VQEGESVHVEFINNIWHTNYAIMKYSNPAPHSDSMKQQKQDGGAKMMPNTQTTVLSMQ